MRDALHDRLLCTALDDYAARETELGAVGPARRSVRPRLRVFIGFVAARCLADRDADGEPPRAA